MLKPLIAFLLALPGQTAAETVMAAHVIRPQSVITAQDLTVAHVEVAGALRDPADLIGQEARVALYPGRPIRPGDIGPPALVHRNQIVTLRFEQSGLTIVTEGRSLSRAGVGERVRVMNLSSRTTVTGRVGSNGTVTVENEGSR